MGRSRLQRAIATAAVLVAAAVIATTQFVHPTLPTAAVANPDDPPSGVDLLYLIGAQPHTLVAYDWSGHRRGSITIPSWVMRQEIHAAPDGGAFVVSAFGLGDQALYLDRLGHVVLQANDDPPPYRIWSDDSRHLCIYDGSSITLRLPGAGEQDRIVSVAADSNVVGDVAIEACSLRRDLAVLRSRTGAFEPGPPTTAVATVRLSTGAVLSSRRFGPADVVTSVDGAYVAVKPQDGTEPTAIYRTADLNQPSGRVDGSIQSLAFSGDDTEMLVTAPSSAGHQIEAIDWRTQRVTWSFDQSGIGAGPTLARPNNHEFAVELVDNKGVPQGVVIAHANGSTTRLPYGIPVMVNN